MLDWGDLHPCEILARRMNPCHPLLSSGCEEELRRKKGGELGEKN